MGNTAVITAADNCADKNCERGVGVYLHWNGGPESVRGFLRAARDLHVRTPDSDETYFLARFAQIVGNFFGGTTSVGVGALKELDCDNGDNGTYFINGKFGIERRQFGTSDGRDKNYELAVYMATLRVNHPIFEREYGPKLASVDTLARAYAKELGIDFDAWLAEEAKKSA